MATDTLLETPPLSAPPAQNDEALYEIIDGQRLELPPTSIYAVRVASRLMSKLNEFGGAHNLGEAISEGLFRLPLARPRNRRPDVAFVGYQRWPKERPVPETENAWDVVPNLAVEVVSPGDLMDEVMDKLEEYFQAGVEVVWVVYPRHRLWYVYTSLTQVRGFTRSDTLDGGQVLPGFQLPLASLFQEPPA